MPQPSLILGAKGLPNLPALAGGKCEHADYFILLGAMYFLYLHIFIVIQLVPSPSPFQRKAGAIAIGRSQNGFAVRGRSTGVLRWAKSPFWEGVCWPDSCNISTLVLLLPTPYLRLSSTCSAHLTTYSCTCHTSLWPLGKSWYFYAIFAFTQKV